MVSSWGPIGSDRLLLHVSAAAAVAFAMLPLLRCAPRALGAAVASVRVAVPSAPLRLLLQPAPRPCTRPFGLLSMRAGSARRPGLLRPRGPCACGCGGLHTDGEFACVGRGRGGQIPGGVGNRGREAQTASRPPGAARRGPEHFPKSWQPLGDTDEPSHFHLPYILKAFRFGLRHTTKTWKLTLSPVS